MCGLPSLVCRAMCVAARAVSALTLSLCMHCDGWAMCAEIYSQGALPWPHVADAELMQRIVQEHARMDRPEQCDSELYSIMEGCWRVERRTRLSAAQVANAVEEHVYRQDGGASSLQGLAWLSVAQLQAGASTSSARQDGRAAALQGLAGVEVSREMVEVGRKLGEGEFGAVHAGVLHGKDGSSRAVAVKMLKGGSSAGSKSAEEKELEGKFVEEARLLHALQHKHIVQLVGAVTAQMPLLMVMELMSGGDLLAYVRRRGSSEASKLSVREQLDVCRQVAEALEHLAAHQVVHRDVAARLVVWLVIGTNLNCACSH